ncbi:MAG: pyridoxamine 5'-phosphate oxidase family protein [Lachnospiraceae bacterium]|nr:pyridoxamine 5'-phosphate oxidase family protein [Lachnospiraceae bacterium]
MRKKAVTNIDFFTSLDYDNGVSVVTDIFRRFPMQYGTTLGRSGKPQIRPLEFKFEKDGVLYFDTVEFYESYKEMQELPYIQVCIGDQETMSYLKVEGKVNFTKDAAIVEQCFQNSPVLESQFGNRRDVVVGYYLTEVRAEFCSFHEKLQNRKYELKNQFDV